MPKVELNSIEDYYQKNKNKSEDRLPFYKRVFINRLKASYQMMYKKKIYIASDKKGKLTLFRRIEGEDDENISR
ncbi:MAG: hypothetical protein V3T32_00510 [Thermodesulfobacteriota bacterium]